MTFFLAKKLLSQRDRSAGPLSRAGHDGGAPGGSGSLPSPSLTSCAQVWSPQCGGVQSSESHPQTWKSLEFRDGLTNTCLSKQEDGPRCPTLNARPGAHAPALSHPHLTSSPGLKHTSSLLAAAHAVPFARSLLAGPPTSLLSPDSLPPSAGRAILGSLERPVPPAHQQGTPLLHMPTELACLHVYPTVASGAVTAGPRSSKG